MDWSNNHHKKLRAQFYITIDTHLFNRFTVYCRVSWIVLTDKMVLEVCAFIRANPQDLGERNIEQDDVLQGPAKHALPEGGSVTAGYCCSIPTAMDITASFDVNNFSEVGTAL